MSRLLCPLVICIALSGCGAAPTVPPASEQPPAAVAAPAPSAAPTEAIVPVAVATATLPIVCNDLPAETAAAATTPIAQTKQTEDGSTQAPDDGGKDSQSQANDNTETDASVPVSYDAKTNTITLGAAAPASLPEVASALKRPDLLSELRAGEWLLSANLRITKGVTFRIASPQVQRLKLRSDAQSFVWIKALGAQLSFSGTCVTSWDPHSNSVDTNDADGRSFVLAREGARMDIRNSELSYLGYYANESYGVAWRQPGTTGSAISSRFGHNFYGMYSYEASDLVIRGNEVHHSVRYGIDPHTRADRLLIENNISHHNGKQGIILAEECSNSVIRGNTVYDNAMHGIVIYQRSNNNIVENNTSYNNGFQGININDSSNNTVRGNTTYGNTQGGIGIGQDAASNTITGNTVRDNLKDGISFYSDASDNTLRDNLISGNTRYGIYVKSPNNTIDSGNQVFGNLVGIYLNSSPAPEVSLDANQVHDNHEANLRTGDG